VAIQDVDGPASASNRSVKGGSVIQKGEKDATTEMRGVHMECDGQNKIKQNQSCSNCLCIFGLFPQPRRMGGTHWGQAGAEATGSTH
jgi:hypothetical protein